MKARTIVRPLVGAALILVGVPALLLTDLLFEPQRYLTPTIIGRAVHVFGGEYKPRWSRLDFEIRSPDVFEKEISFGVADFCFGFPDGSLSGCFKSLRARFTVEFSPSGVRVTKVSRLDLDGESLRIDQTKARKSPRSGFDPFSLPRFVPSFLSGVKIEELGARLNSVEIVEAGAATRGSLELGFTPGRAQPLRLGARWSQKAGGATRHGRADLTAASDFFKTGRLTYADIKGSLRAQGAQALLSVTARQAGAQAVSLEVQASGSRAGLRFLLHGSGVESPTRYSLAGDLAVDASSLPVKNARLQDFEFTAEREKGEALPRAVHLRTAVRVEPAQRELLRGFKAPQYLAGKLILNARATPQARQKDHFDADLSLVLNPYASWYEVRANAFAKASGRLSELSRARVEQHVEASVDVARFQDVIKLLAGGPYAIPAPFNALNGSLRLSLADDGDSQTDGLKFECEAAANLAEDRQKLVFHLKGGGQASSLGSPGRSIKAQAEASFDDVAIQVPHLDALKMPGVTMDSRIKTRAAKLAERAAAQDRAQAQVAGSTSAVSWELRVGTAKPIILYTDLAKSPVPVALDLKLARPPSQMSGAVEVKSFNVEFFRRKATVEHMTLSFRPGSKLIALDGLIKYQATEAMIDIRLLGTTDNPQVIFESDPPLSQSDIVAMLVFGKSPDELDPDQAATVANTQTAMTDKAFGLASLYLFASTPIQFVGYDPATKSYEIKFRIPGGETLQVSSDFDSTKMVSLRKRISRHFAIEAQAVNSPTQGNGIVTFLEWFARY